MKQKHGSFSMQMRLWFSVVAILVTASSPFSPLLAAPANDSFASAIIISSLPYISTGINTEEATVEPGKDLPLIACNRNAGNHSVWFRYTPTSNELIRLDTKGSQSGYDTMLGVFIYESSILSLVGCDDDSGGNLKSSVTVVLTSGKNYYFVVSSYNGDYGDPCAACDPGGDLVFHVTSFGVPLQVYLPLIMR